MRALDGIARASLVALALTAGAGTAISQEQGVLDLVTECDILAGHSSDLERMAEGVTDERIIPRLATRACEQAVADNPKEARFVFQLGRAKLAAGKRKEAAALFEKAAEAGHAASWAYLGDAYQFGYDGEPNAGKAYHAYNKAVEGGFERAKALSELMHFEPKMYAGDVIERIYNGHLQEISARAKVEQRKWPTRSYIFAMTQKFLAECDRPLSPPTVPALFTFRYGDGWTAENDVPTNVTVQSAAGEFDGQTFLKRHGCESPVATQLFVRIEQLLGSQ